MKEVAYLNGLRGVAILMVMLIHSGGWGLRQLGEIGNSIADHGKYGVTVFFVTSAYVLCMTADAYFEGKSYSWKSFFLRRFFRIAPMYYIVLLTLVATTIPEGWPGFKSLLLHFTFLNALYPKYANDIIGVEWSIAVEAAFYLSFPALAWLSRKSDLLIVVLAAAFSAPALREVVYSSMGGDLYDYRHYSLPWHGYAFLFGLVIYRLRDVQIPTPVSWFSALLLAGQILSGESPWSGPIVALSTAIAIACSRDGKMPCRWLSLEPLTFVGRISYSLYLTHALLIVAFGPYLFLPVALGLATVTYRFVEEPFRKLGRQLLSVHRIEGSRRPGSADRSKR